MQASVVYMGWASRTVKGPRHLLFWRGGAGQAKMVAYHSYMDTTDVSARHVTRVSPATGAAGGPGWMPALLVAASQERDTEPGHALC